MNEQSSNVIDMLSSANANEVLNGQTMTVLTPSGGWTKSLHASQRTSTNCCGAGFYVAGIAVNKINPLIEELLEDGSLHVWQEKRPGTNPRTSLARYAGIKSVLPPVPRGSWRLGSSRTHTTQNCHFYVSGDLVG
jgi:hypothetical protein